MRTPLIRRTKQSLFESIKRQFGMVLNHLRQELNGISSGPSNEDISRISRILFRRIQEADSVFFFTGDVDESNTWSNSILLNKTIASLNSKCPCYEIGLRLDDNGQGSENVLTWTFGFRLASN